MDCGQENNTNIKTSGSFVPKTELDYLLLGCLLESQQFSTTQCSPNTIRQFSMYQKQFETHKQKKSAPPMMMMGYRINNGSTTFTGQFPQNNMTSGQSQFNNNNNNINKMPFQNYNGPIINNNNQHPQNMNLKMMNNPPPNRNNLQQQNVPPNLNLNMMLMDDDSMEMSSEISKKDKKKPKRPNKVKPMGCEWCKVTSSPVWRGGPTGKGSLCNACGLQYMKGFTMERAKETLRKNRGEWKINSQM